MNGDSTSVLPPSGRVLLDDPNLDQVVRMVVALGAELSTALMTIDTLSRLLQDKGILTAEEIAAYVPLAAAQAERDARLRVLIRNLMHGLSGEFSS